MTVLQQLMKPAAFRQKLLAELDRDDLSIDELVSRSEELLNVLAPKQTRYKVTEKPDVRTIRYYTARSLLPKPVGYRGGRARYSGSHLLRLLLVKKMQAEHHSLRKIAQELKDKDDSAIVAQLVPEHSAPLDELFALPDRHRAEQREPVVSSRIRRMAIVHGVNVDIGEDVFADETRRSEVADALEALAQQLRHNQ